ncbi:Alpha/Beta hydrolase protein [Chaetomium fimeti]|uniref:Alpha/Beta hydrolase protein n=1 Tax=Chaetomium fimeti TaxID=1854472 RepID=A0AAE0HNK2_9PEZI|nr:Alpha/Beta hydrolase protein [Chaetomium fimeti]
MQAPVCRDCFTGTLRDDATPTGHEEVIYGLPTYVTRPEPGVKPLGTVVFITDAFGWKLRNSRTLADAYAKRVPCIVYVPDFMNGHAFPESLLSAVEPPPTVPPTTLTGRLFTHLRSALTALRLLPTVLLFLFRTRQSVTHPRVLAFLTALRTTTTTTTTTTKVGVAGFCWGGLHTILLTHDVPRNRYRIATAAQQGGNEGPGEEERPLIDCGFTAHPSLLSFPAHIERVERPLSVAIGDEDAYVGRENVALMERVLGGKNEADAEGGGGAGAGAGGDGGEPEGVVLGRGPRYEMVMYPGARHGFAVRGNREDPAQREMGEQCEDQAVRWFRVWFR